MRMLTLFLFVFLSVSFSMSAKATLSTGSDPRGWVDLTSNTKLITGHVVTHIDIYRFAGGCAGIIRFENQEDRVNPRVTLRVTWRQSIPLPDGSIRCYDGEAVNFASGERQPMFSVLMRGRNYFRRPGSWFLHAGD